MPRRTLDLGRIAALGLTTWLGAGTALAQQPGPDAPAPEPPDEPAAPDADASEADTAERPATPNPAPPPAQDITQRFDTVLAQPGGLTSERVAERAVATNWSIKSLEKDQEIAELNVDQAVAAYLPEVTLIARYTRLSPVENGGFGGGPDVNIVTANDPVNGTYAADYDGFSSFPLSGLFDGMEFPVFLNNYHLQASLRVPISDYVLRAGHGLSAARHNRRFAKLNRDAEALHTAASAKLVYYDWVRAELNLVIVEESRVLAEERLRVAKAGLAGGRLSRADVLSAEADLARAELMLSQARNQATLAEDRLSTIMHDATPGPYSVGENVMNVTPPPSVEPFDKLYAEAIDRRLEVRALELNKKSLEEAADTMRADNYPRLSAFGNAYYMNPSQRVFPQEDRFRAHWDVGLELTWTPTKIATARAESRKYDVQAQQRDSDIQNFRDGLRTEVMQARQMLLEATLNLETTQRGLTATEEGYRVQRKLYEYGRATSVEVKQAENQLLSARLAVVDARVNLITAQVRLEHVVGRDVGSL